MGQINVSYDDATIVGLDRLAAARSLARTDLLRLIASEAIEANDAGRLAFQVHDGPRLDGSINALTIQLREALLELDRTQRSNQRHERKLLGAFVGSEDAVHAAEDKIWQRLNDLSRASQEPIINAIDGIRGEIAAGHAATVEAIDGGWSKVEKRLSIVHAAASQPRNQYQLVLGATELSLRSILTMVALIAATSIFLFLILAMQIRPIGSHVAGRVVRDTGQICQLIDRRYGVNDCAVPVRSRSSDRRAGDRER